MLRQNLILSSLLLRRDWSDPSDAVVQARIEELANVWMATENIKWNHQWSVVRQVASNDTAPRKSPVYWIDFFYAGHGLIASSQAVGWRFAQDTIRAFRAFRSHICVRERDEPERLPFEVDEKQLIGWFILASSWIVVLTGAITFVLRTGLCTLELQVVRFGRIRLPLVTGAMLACLAYAPDVLGVSMRTVWAFTASVTWLRLLRWLARVSFVFFGGLFGPRAPWWSPDWYLAPLFWLTRTVFQIGLVRVDHGLHFHLRFAYCRASTWRTMVWALVFSSLVRAIPPLRAILVISACYGAFFVWMTSDQIRFGGEEDPEHPRWYFGWNTIRDWLDRFVHWGIFILGNGSRLTRCQGGADSCLFCWETLTERPCVKAPCGHTFHEDCAVRWFRTKPRCPLCRKSATGRQ